jgi:hypothetical protein
VVNVNIYLLLLLTDVTLDRNLDHKVRERFNWINLEWILLMCIYGTMDIQDTSAEKQEEVLYQIEINLKRWIKSNWPNKNQTGKLVSTGLAYPD